MCLAYDPHKYTYEHALDPCRYDSAFSCTVSIRALFLKLRVAAFFISSEHVLEVLEPEKVVAPYSWWKLATEFVRCLRVYSGGADGRSEPVEEIGCHCPEAHEDVMRHSLSEALRVVDGKVYG
jgi:hypothetical protein